MTSSRSNTSISRWLVVLAALVLWVGQAEAGRRRVVVLEFDGPKAEKFHEDVIKLVKKSHTVISVDKWNAAAEELDAGKVTEKNVKKIAKKLKVDGVITGKIEKRRDEYIIKLKLRAGTTGEITGNSVSTKADGPRLDGQAQRDIKDELIGAIDELESNRGGGDEEEEEDKPAKKKKGSDEEEEEPAKKSGFSRKNDEEEEEEKPAKKKKAEIEEEKAVAKKKKADEEEEEEKPKKKKKADDEESEALSTKKAKGDDEEEEEPKSKKRAKSSDDEEDDEEGGKRKASSEDDEESVEDEVEVDSSDKALNVSPGRRAIDAVVGLSFTARRLNFTYAGDLAKAPPGYKQSIPVAGALIDLTFYPMSFGHKKQGIITGIGLNVLYDQVLKINSQKRYADGAGMQQIADLETKESRWSVGGVFRYPLGTGPKALVTGGSLSYGRQKFTVAQELPNMEKTDIPNVHYSMLTPAAFLRAPITDKITFNLDAAFHAVLDTGAIQKPDQYGAATVTGFEFEAGADYMLTGNIFARAGVRVQTIGISFKGDPTSQTHTRDNEPMDQDVSGARDTYFGGTATVGYLY